jgi:hypothetical protein
MLFESDIIKVKLEAGMTPGLPKLFDADAIIKISSQQGILDGLISMMFFYSCYFFRT